MKAYTLLIKAFALIGLCGLCYVYGHNKGFEKGTKACNEYLEEKVTLEKAIKLKQATTAQLKALEKEHQIAITNLYMDAQAEQDKIDKENKDKEKAKQKDATE